MLFNGAMVRAILDGRKTQTRRVIKNVPSWDHLGREIMDWDLSGIHQIGYGEDDQLEGTERWYVDVQTDVDDHSRDVIRCPFGRPGDRLWVRETWAHYQTVDHTHRPDGRTFSEVSDGLAGYRADGFDSIEDFREHIRLMGGPACEAVEISGNRWRPSIHMPRWACRLVLEITAVRVERLQAISEADAIAEGAEPTLVPPDGGSCPYTEGFRDLWTSTGGDWNANPWVWVIEFKRVTGTEGRSDG